MTPILLVGLVVALAVLAGALRRFRAECLARELTDEDRMFDAYLRDIGWNDTGEQIDGDW